jgi:probable rRNA maturation factor
MNAINYFFEDIKSYKHQLPKKMWIQQCLKKEKQTAGCINFIFCSDLYLQKINKEYLKKSDFTDVIAFQFQKPSFTYKNTKNLIFGDVFISIERVKENKKIYKTIFSKEIQRVMIHGVLHLIGYNDKTKKEKEVMTVKENLYLTLI